VSDENLYVQTAITTITKSTDSVVTTTTEKISDKSTTTTSTTSNVIELPFVPAE
jgi:hypothetical protein